MANFAVINGGKVSNIIVADTKEIAEEVTGVDCVEYTDDAPIGTGMSLNEKTSKWEYPEPLE